MASKVEVTNKYTTVSWDEKPVTAISGSNMKITRLRSDRVFAGESNRMQGKGVAEYTMVYHENGETDPHKMTASYAGLMHFTGTIDGGEEGEIVFMTTGTYDKGVEASWIVDSKTGTGGLKGLKGKGGYASKGREAEIWLEVEKA